MLSNRTNNKITILKNLKKVKETFKDYDYDIVKNEDNSFNIFTKDGETLFRDNFISYARLDLTDKILKHRLKIIKRYIDRNE